MADVGPVRHVIEEMHDGAQVIRAGLLQFGNPGPHQPGRAVQPGMPGPAPVQRAGQQPGGDQGRRPAFFRHPPRRVRPSANIFRNEDRAPLVGCVRLEPFEGSANQAVVPGVRLVQGFQGELDGQRLAARAPAVRLERVAEPAVRVAVGGDRVTHVPGPPAAQQPLEPALVQNPAGGRQELPGRGNVNVR
jgi:hypothetical protein